MPVLMRNSINPFQKLIYELSVLFWSASLAKMQQTKQVKNGLNNNNLNSRVILQSMLVTTAIKHVKAIEMHI